jgi:hypothetical protein
MIQDDQQQYGSDKYSRRTEGYVRAAQKVRLDGQIQQTLTNAEVSEVSPAPRVSEINQESTN